MKILITGATGLIGQKLALRFFQEGHTLVFLTRNAPQAKITIGLPGEFFTWDPMQGMPPLSAFQGVDAIVHLLGESIAKGRWNTVRKQRILNSRVVGTQNLVAGLEAFQKTSGSKKLQIFLAASAIGFYGDQGDQLITEHSPVGSGFLAEVCHKWEEALQLPSDTRVVRLRLGLILDRSGGALPKMTLPFAMGLGATLGSGQEWVSWIHVDDVVEAFCFALKSAQISGPVNVISPNAVMQREFAQTLALALKTKAWARIPQFMLKAALGELSTLILDSTRVTPGRLVASGFQFQYPTLQAALTQLIGEFPKQMIESSQWIEKPIEEVFSFFSEPKNLEKFTPPWIQFPVKTQTADPVGQGTEITYGLRLYGVPLWWKSRIGDWVPLQKFVDRQLSGPYKLWHHTHTFQSLQNGVLIQDHVVYELPLGLLGRMIAGAFVKGEVAKIFTFRRKRIFELFKKQVM